MKRNYLNGNSNNDEFLNEKFEEETMKCQFMKSFYQYQLFPQDFHFNDFALCYKLQVNCMHLVVLMDVNVFQR